MHSRYSQFPDAFMARIVYQVCNFVLDLLMSLFWKCEERSVRQHRMPCVSGTFFYPVLSRAGRRMGLDRLIR